MADEKPKTLQEQSSPTGPPVSQEVKDTAPAVAQPDKEKDKAADTKAVEVKETEAAGSKKLDDIVHPEVKKYILREIERSRKEETEFFFIEAALLLEEKYDEILEFSELGEFIDVPIKNYSSGMKARLGFSIATVVEPEILILDEVLSVGDAKFRKKCEKKMQGMFDHGVTVLFVSHSLQQVERLCNKAILLDHGQLIAKGDIDEVSAIYQSKLND